jgi:hypothetical protein
MPWPLALMEIADRGLINGSRLLRLKLFGLSRSPAPPVSITLSFALTPEVGQDTPQFTLRA